MSAKEILGVTPERMESLIEDIACVYAKEASDRMVLEFILRAPWTLEEKLVVAYSLG
jgi:hypothetical protein